MLTVKIETCHSTPKDKIFEIVSCDAVAPIVQFGGELIGVRLESYGANNQTGQSFERTVIFNAYDSENYGAESNDDNPFAVYVENSHGKTVQCIMRRQLKRG